MRIVFFFLFIAICVQISARDIWIDGAVMNASTGRRIYGGRISVIDTNSNTILNSIRDEAPTENEIIQFGDRRFSINFWCADSVNIILTAEIPNFKSEPKHLSFPKDFDETFRMDTIWVVPADCDNTAEQLIHLREVTVKATKIKMVMHGDTITYNADAFNLSTGSMLDALVAQLPGVELSGDGQIKVNGKYVSSLFVDGKEFFNGNPNVALRNLPAYTVKKVQVYHHDYSEGLDKSVSQEDIENLPLVMDVRLKPQYQKGFISNLTAGYGLSKNRYLGRLFGMEYARNGRITAFAQTNNINDDTSGPGIYDSSDWKNKLSTDGQRQVVKTGINFNWSRGTQKENNKFEITGDILFSHLKGMSIIRTAEELYLPDMSSSFSNSYARDADKSNRLNCEFKWSTINHFFTLFANSGLTLNYIKSAQQQNKSQYGTRHEQIYYSDLSNSAFSRSHTAYTYLNFLNPKLGSTRAAHNLYLDWKLDYKTNNNQSIHNINYVEDAAYSFLHQQGHTFDRNLYLSPSYRFIYELASFNRNGYSLSTRLIPKYTYQHQVGRRNIYELDNPFQSMSDAIIDVTNSYFSVETNNIGSLNAEIHYWKGQTNIDLTLMGQMNHAHLLYQRGSINADFAKSRWRWNTQFKSKWEVDGHSSRHRYRANANINRSLPSLITLLETTDDSNPLAIYKGNPDLKSSTTLSANLEYTNICDSKKREIGWSFYYNYYWNRRSQYRNYDAISGVSTYMPINVSGAYTFDTSIRITSKLDRDNRWYILSSTNASYENIPDYISLDNTDAILSKVRNIVIKENLRVDWSISENYSLSAGVIASWRQATSPLSSFTKVNVFDFTPKIAGRLRLPLSIDIATDLNIYSHLGYFDPSFNTTNFIWNASISRPFLRGKLIGKVEAYDILGQIDNITATINSLGRIETWTNSLPRYVLFSLSYQFSIMPSKTRQ